jgi:hypothetical protein
MIRSRQRPSSMANGGSNSAECGCCSNHDVGSASPDNNTCTTSPASSQSSARSATSHSVPRNIRHKRTTAQRIIAIRHILSLIASIIFFSSVGLMLHYPQISNRLIMLHEASSPLPFLTQFVQQSSFSSCEAPAEASFTLVTQCSDDRLWMMEYHCQRWSVGNERPMLSLVVYTNSTVDEIIKSLAALKCPIDNMSVQTLPADRNAADFPVNELRNMAFSQVATSHAVYVDIDFWTATDLYATLTSDAVQSALLESHRHALVLPAFQLHRQCGGWRECPERNIPLMPTTRTSIMPLLIKHIVTAFDPTNLGGHGSTRYNDWLEQRDDQLLEINCVISNRYEPYLVVRVCQDLAPFQPAFTGYGKNKMTWIMQLRRMGYRFFQIPAFVVHYPHLDSQSRLAWNAASPGHVLSKPKGRVGEYKRGQNDKTFVEFRSWLEKTVPDQSVVHKCEAALDDDARLWIERKDGSKGKASKMLDQKEPIRLR